MIKKVKDTLLKSGLALVMAVALLVGMSNTTVNARVEIIPGIYTLPVVSLVSKAPLQPVNDAFAKAFGESITMEAKEDGSCIATIDLQHMVVNMGAQGSYHCNVLTIEGSTVLEQEVRQLTPTFGRPTETITHLVPTKVQLPINLDENNQQKITLTVDFMNSLMRQDIYDPYPTVVTLTLGAMEPVLADFTQLDTVLAQVPKDLSIYTEDSVAYLQSLLPLAEDRDINAIRQAEVDQLAAEIDEAIQSLELKPGVTLGSWKSNSKGWWYEYTDGTYIANDFKEIDGKTYYFGNYGYMVTDFQYIDGSWYWFDASGAMYKNGWKWINGSCYYFFENGKMAADTEIDGSYVNKSGAWTQNQWMHNQWGWWYSYAKGGYPKNELKYINGQTYYFDEYGYIKTDFQFIEGEWYWFDASGAMYKNGWKWVDGACYYFHEDGVMARNETIDGSYVNWSGAWTQDRWVHNQWGWWYSYAKGGYPKSEMKEINGKTYYFDEYGYIVTGFIFVNQEWYCFDASGAMYANGWQWVDGAYYYFHEDGVMARNETIDGSYVNWSGAWVP